MRIRGAAAILALLFVAHGVLAIHHEASAVHVHDYTGAFVHAKALAGHHASHDSDIHGQHDPEADAGDCVLLTTFHQATSATITPPAIVAAVRTVRAHRIPRITIVSPVTDVFRLAPKTSPPAIV